VAGIDAAITDADPALETPLAQVAQRSLSIARDAQSAALIQTSQQERNDV
jgi:hypothetical protein